MRRKPQEPRYQGGNISISNYRIRVLRPFLDHSKRRNVQNYGAHGKLDREGYGFDRLVVDGVFPECHGFPGSKVS